MKHVYEISVRSLVRFALKTGDLESHFTGTSRSVEAIYAHQAIQKSRPPEYVAEVTVSHEHETDRYNIKINGRIDGIFTHPDGITIDEIKTTQKDLEKIVEEENVLHWGQAKVYAYIYGRQYQFKEVSVQLTYYHLDTREIKTVKKHFSLDALESFFNGIIEAYTDWMHLVSTWVDIRNNSIKALSFPFETYRPGQRQMAVDSYLAIKKKCQLIVEAPTGIGKTIAVIFPSVKAISENLTTGFFYLTARTTGKTVCQKALNVLRDNGLKLKSIEITAKDRICPNKEAACTPQECDRAKGYYDRLKDAMWEIYQEDEFSRDNIEKVAKTHSICPFEFSLDLSTYADAVVCDYNYAFDPRVYLKRFFDDRSDRYTFLIDEAHNLIDRARDMFSAEIFKNEILAVRKQIKEELPQLHKTLTQINTWMNDAKKSCSEAGGFATDPNLPETLLPRLRTFIRTTEKWLVKNVKTPFQEDLTELYFNISGFLKISERFDSHYITCFETGEDDFKIKLFCIDPSKNMQEALKRCDACVFFSATLTPLSYYSYLFGCEESVYTRSLPSPFPEKNLCVVNSGQLSTYFRDREKTKHEIANVLAAFIQQKTGNYLIFFPSYTYLEIIRPLFERACPNVELLVQMPDMRENEKNAFLEKFAPPPAKPHVGFAVMGGIFGEGIDLVGERLSGVAVISPGLPGISKERNLIKSYFDEVNNAGFDYAYVFPGLNRVLQAAGRVIRTETDRGVIFLIDKRFQSPKYLGLLPCYWRPRSSWNRSALETIIRDFWEK